MKKLFVILPLVLVLVLSSLSVMAQTQNDVAKATPWDGCFYTLPAANLYKLSGVDVLACKTNCIPIWLGEYSPCSLKGTASQQVQGNVWKGLAFDATYTVNLLNKGEPVEIVEANLQAVSYPQLATIFMQNSEWGKTYKIAEPILKNVIPMTLEVWVSSLMVPGVTQDKAVNVPVEIVGLLIVVEDMYDSVLINHHIVRATGELVFQSEAAYPANDRLDAAHIPAEWVNTDFVDVTYDPAQTKVSEVWDESTILTMGQRTFLGWEVDLYYVAAKAEGDQSVDAAKPQAPAAAAPVQLPATGAADTTVLALSSLALVVLGVFFKK